MGMDVYGVSGNYHRSNVWHWHPLWTYCASIACARLPEIDWAMGHYNDGYLVEEEDANILGEMLAFEVARGATAEYAEAYKAKMDSLPDEPCKYCEQTGERHWPQPDGTTETRVCNACQGKRTLRPFETHYHFCVDHVSEFADFCVESNGFRIH